MNIALAALLPFLLRLVRVEWSFRASGDMLEVASIAFRFVASLLQVECEVVGVPRMPMSEDLNEVGVACRDSDLSGACRDICSASQTDVGERSSGLRRSGNQIQVLELRL